MSFGGRAGYCKLKPSGTFTTRHQL